jgi:hypothetical protein
MEILIWIGLGIIGWVIVGSLVLSAIDQNLEITTRKRQYPVLLVFIINLLWPIVSVLYLLAKRRRHG